MLSNVTEALVRTVLVAWLPDARAVLTSMPSALTQVSPAEWAGDRWRALVYREPIPARPGTRIARKEFSAWLSRSPNRTQMCIRTA
jgi:hypothetical protein